MCWFSRVLPLSQGDLDPMIRGHQITLDLAKTPGLLGMLNELHGNPEKRKLKTPAEVAAFLNSYQIQIPAGGTVEIRELEANAWEVEIRITEGLYSYVNGFNSDKGFYRVQGPQRPRK